MSISNGASEEYVPKFDRLGVERRILGHITDEDHVGRGPRNTVPRLARELAEDPHTNYQGSEPIMQEYVNALVAAGLVAQRADGTYAVTDAGLIELRN